MSDPIDYQLPDGTARLAIDLNQTMQKCGYEEWTVCGVSSRKLVDRLTSDLSTAQERIKKMEGELDSLQTQIENKEDPLWLFDNDPHFYRLATALIHTQSDAAIGKQAVAMGLLKAECADLKSERDKLQEELEDITPYRNILIKAAKRVSEVPDDSPICDLVDVFKDTIEDVLVAKIEAAETVAASIQKELEEVKEELDKAKTAAKGFAHSSESWELLHAKRHEELEKARNDYAFLSVEHDAATAENARLREALKWNTDRLEWAIQFLSSHGDVEKMPWHSATEWIVCAKDCVVNSKEALSPQSPEPAAVEETISNDSSGVESRHANSSGSGPERKDDDQVTKPVTDRENREIHMANSLDKTHSESSASPAVTFSTKGGDAGLGATPETKGESETPETDAFWQDHFRMPFACKNFAGEKERERNELRKIVAELEKQVMQWMENWNSEYDRHSELIIDAKELAAARDKAEAELKVAREDSERLDWLATHRFDRYPSAGEGFSQVVFTDYSCKETLREAIDDARKEAR